MKINLVCPVLVLDNESNSNIRKNDIMTLKLLVKRDNSLVSVKLKDKEDIKETLKVKLKDIIGNDKFHLEQVYTLGEDKYYIDNCVDVIYLSIMNISSIKKLNDDYKLIDFSIKNNVITFGDNNYCFKTVEKVKNNSIEYFHEIKVDDIILEKKLLELIISYKKLRSEIDFSDVIFKFMGSIFTLEDVRIVYELLKEVSVDKSNFRKKIIKYCEEVPMKSSGKGYRPSKMYKFKILRGDIWL